MSAGVGPSPGGLQIREKLLSVQVNNEKMGFPFLRSDTEQLESNVQ